MNQRRISVRKSPVHGRGVFAIQNLEGGELVCEYKGKRVPWSEAMRRSSPDPAQPDHTFFFDVGDGFVIDGGNGGNSARWINHSCEPNCEPELEAGHIFIRALKSIGVGEELSIDYALVGGRRQSKRLRERYACFCGAPDCRGTMLAGRRSR